MQSTDRRALQATQRGSPKRISIRIDLTPMVDLGFLLITFFMLTTVLAKPQIMPVILPEQDGNVDPQPVKNSTVLTLLLGGQNQVYWYEGVDGARLDSTGYMAGGLRRIILDKKNRVFRQWGDESRPDSRHAGASKQVSRLTVIIKPTAAASYKNVVDALDEMRICGIARYVLLDVSEAELDFIRNPAAGLKYSIAEQMAAARH